ncbi:restriction endonuclease subunit S [Aliarcobacter butzleri]|uniref:restriction endonuclease subunit S n=1 Tax=Aliarcobacter butzleri TaxID=28197 RepID=UPI003B21FED0
MSNVPKLRFKEFSGEWEEKLFGDIVTNKSKKYNPEKESISYKCIELEHLSTESGELLGYVDSLNLGSIKNKFNKNNVLFGKLRPYLKKYLLAPFDGVCSSEIWVLNGVDVTNCFLYYIVQSDYFIGLANQSSGSKMPRADWNIIKNSIFFIPEKQEQEKIASFLTSVDTKIEQLTKKEELLQQYKKGVMQKIFNQEIRFKADDGSEFCEWEEKKLGDILDYIQPTKYLVKGTEYNDSYIIPVLTAGKTFILGYTNETDGVFENNLPVIIFDDFTTANKFVNFPFKAKSSAMKILVLKNNNNIKFIYEAMQMIKYEVGGHERHWISKFSFLNIFIPCIEEQTKIANFLSSIDSKIEQVQKQLNFTKEFKKALLQQMFV